MGAAAAAAAARIQNRISPHPRPSTLGGRAKPNNASRASCGCFELYYLAHVVLRFGENPTALGHSGPFENNCRGPFQIVITMRKKSFGTGGN